MQNKRHNPETAKTPNGEEPRVYGPPKAEDGIVTLNSLDSTRSAAGETGQLEREPSRTRSLQSPRGAGRVRSACGSPRRGHLPHGSV